jgi:hypothetical protein
MTPAETIAERLFNEHYIVIYDSDCSEEILVSILAKQHAIITAKYLLKQTKNNFYEEVIEKLKSI